MTQTMTADPDTVARLEDENRLLRERVEKLARFEPRLAGIEQEGDSVHIRFENAKEVVQMFADAFWRILADLSAENYVETKFLTPEGVEPPGLFTVTVQRHLRKTPHEFRREAESARDAALAEVADLRASFDEAWECKKAADAMLGEEIAASDALRAALRDALYPGRFRVVTEERRKEIAALALTPAPPTNDDEKETTDA